MGRRAGLPKVDLDDAHGDVYQYRFTVHGKRYRGSTGRRDHDSAQDFANNLYADALKGKKPQPNVRRYGGVLAKESLITLFASFVASLENKKSRGYLDKIESHFRSHFSHRWATLEEILEPGAVDAYATERLNGDAPAVEDKPRRPRPKKGSTVTVAKELVTLRRFLKWCRKRQLIDHVPDWEPVKPISDYQPPDLTPSDVRALLEELPDRRTHHRRFPVREFFTVQWAQGLRPGELESLRWQDVNLSRREMTVRQSEDKARVGRTMHLVPEAVAVLEQLTGDALPSALIFGAVRFQRSLDLATAQLGMPHVTPHHFRHARLTELGHSPRATPGALRSFAGHKHLSTTDRYLRTQAKAVRVMLEGLDSDTIGAKRKTSRRKHVPDSATAKRASTRNYNKR